MKLNLKNTLIATSIAAGLFGASAFAIAQNGNGTGPNAEMRAQHMAQRADNQGPTVGQQRMARMEKMQQRMAARQAQLKADRSWRRNRKPPGTPSSRPHRTPSPVRPVSNAKTGPNSPRERLDKMQAATPSAAADDKRIRPGSCMPASRPSGKRPSAFQGMRGFHRTGMRGDMGKHRPGKGMGQPGAQGVTARWCKNTG
ncbi:MAG: hypothetical protein R3E56_06535 [Burkholderiaceae bacterium]